MELWLKYKNDDGALRRVAVGVEKFTVGRHSDNDLCVPKNQLSRRHAEIDRYENAFILTDANSSNGTTLNGKPLARPTALKNGDRINLGGGAELEVEIISDARNLSASAKDEKSPSENAAQKAETDQVKESEAASEAKVAVVAPAIVQSAPPQKSGIGVFFIIAPVLVFFVLVLGGLILWLAGGSKGDTAKNSGKEIYAYPEDENEKPNRNKKSSDASPSPTSTPKPNDNASPVNSSAGTETKDTPVAAPISAESDTVEKNALSFLRRIPNGNPSPVLTAKQIAEISAAIKSFKGSPALISNLQALKKNSAQIESLAKSKNLRAQFLAAAALAKLGNSSSDPLAAAQGAADELNALANQVANESADESLIIIAAYQDGGSQSKLPSMLANLTKKFPADARRIRTIWFLHDNGKITEAQYQFALKFLAVGTIMQNPKDFNVQSDAVIFN